MNLTLGQRVRMKRRAQDLTLRQVADAIGMSKTWVADLARHFGVSTTAAQLRMEALAPSFARSAGEVG